MPWKLNLLDHQSFVKSPTCKCFSEIGSELVLLSHRLFLRNKDCNFASLDADNSNGGDNGAETITLFQESLYVYTIFVQLYEDGISNTPLSQSGGRVAIFRSVS